MLEYDLERVFEHPLSFRMYLPSALVILGEGGSDSRQVQVQWRESATTDSQEDELLIFWDMGNLKKRFAEIDEEIECMRLRNQDRATQVEEAAVIVAVAVMAHVAPTEKFTGKSTTGTRHDYFLNETIDEMIEIAGRWQGGLPSLFAEKQGQSDRNLQLKRRWISTTIFQKQTRNRTELLEQ